MEHGTVESKASKASAKQTAPVPDQQHGATISSVHHLLKLQRTIGNQAVAHLIQAKPVATQDPSYGTLLGRRRSRGGVQRAPLQVDTASVQTDRSRVGELIADINKNTPKIEEAEKENFRHGVEIWAAGSQRNGTREPVRL